MISQVFSEVVDVLPERKLSQTGRSEDYGKNDDINWWVQRPLLIWDFSWLCPVSPLNWLFCATLSASNQHVVKERLMENMQVNSKGGEPYPGFTKLRLGWQLAGVGVTVLCAFFEACVVWVRWIVYDWMKWLSAGHALLLGPGQVQSPLYIVPVSLQKINFLVLYEADQDLISCFGKWFVEWT